MTKEDLQQLSDLIDKKLDPINDRLEKLEDQMTEIKEEVTELKGEVTELKEEIAEIKEDTKITRAATNELVKWVELNSTGSNPFPVDKAI